MVRDLAPSGWFAVKTFPLPFPPTPPTMPSPFPGMDPYLEGYLWPDVHHVLANKIRQQLAPRLRPNYLAHLEIYLAEDPFPDAERRC